jgi:molybdenum cofactor cytidylyltransferase
MGADNKLLMTWRGKPLVAHVVDQLLASSIAHVVVVTGYEQDKLRGALAGRPVIYVDNPRFAWGLSTSLIAGIDAVPADADGVLVALGDMPRIETDVINRLIAAFNPAEGRSICLPVFDGKWGNPVLWARSYLDQMATLSGDAGAKSLLQSNLNAICEVAVADDAVLVDIDTPEAFAELAP